MGGGAGGGLNAGSGASPPSSTQSFRPWKGQKPFIMDIYNQAQQQSQTPQQFYPGQTYANFDPATEQALQAQQAVATGGNTLAGSARTTLQDTLNGRYLDPNSNPYLDATYNQAARSVTRNFNEAVLPGLEARFATAGRLGSGAYGAGLDRASMNLATSLSDLGTNIFGQNYQAERGRQDQAAQNAGALQAADYGDIQQLANVGATREQQAQKGIDELINRFDFAQQEPRQRLQQYASMIGAPIGGQTTLYGNTPRPGDWWSNSILGKIFGG